MKLSELKNKKILILGFGREGKDTYNFLKKEGLACSIADIKKDIKENTILHLGPSYLNSISDYDIIIRSPGIPLPIIRKYLTSKQTITSQTEIFFSNVTGSIIGITGTKGKSTIASLIYEVLKEKGLKVYLIGNIGNPVLKFLKNNTKEDIFVYELSSFQLATIKTSPHIAVFLNLYQEHLDWHSNFEEYMKAKTNITKFQTKDDYLIFNKQDKNVNNIAKESKANKIGYNGNSITSSKESVLLVSELFKISNKDAQKTITEFKGLDHRMKNIGKYNDITFYNDSLSTIPEATIGAIDILGDNLQTLILGGHDRGVSYEKLGKRIAESNIKTLILFPDTGKKILTAVKNNNIKHVFVDTMKKAVERAFEATNKEKICLLSPASSSFNLFKNYEDRGNQFKKYVKEISHS